MRKPAWTRRVGQRTSSERLRSYRATIIETAVNEARADITEALVKISARDGLGPETVSNGSGTHWGLRNYGSPALSAEKATLAWLHARGYVERKAVPGDGTFYRRSFKTACLGVVRPARSPRQRMHYRG